jgi:hypothetical protein
VNTEKAEARFENGILTLRLPKAEEAKERRIRIEGGARREIGQGGEVVGGNGGRTGSRTGTGSGKQAGTQAGGTSEARGGRPEVVHGSGTRSG